MGIFVKNGILCIGDTVDEANPVFVPREAGTSSQSLVWGLDRETGTLNVLNVDTDGNLGVSFSGSISIGTVEIKDPLGTKLNVLSGEGQTISTTGGILTFGGYNDSGTLKTKLLRLDSNGNLLVSIVSPTTFATESTLLNVTRALAGPTGVVTPLSATIPGPDDYLDLSGDTGSVSWTTSIEANWRPIMVLLHSDIPISQTVTITLISSDGSNYDTVLGKQSFVDSQDIIWIPDTQNLKLKNGDELKIECTDTGGPEAKVYISVRYEKI